MVSTLVRILLLRMHTSSVSSTSCVLTLVRILLSTSRRIFLCMSCVSTMPRCMSGSNISSSQSSSSLVRKQKGLQIIEETQTKILAMDINRENYELGLTVIQKADVAHKIEYKGPAMPKLNELVEDEKNHGSYDFIFVDADKDNYINYHERLVKLVKVGGLIGYDNTLWNGSVVAPPDAPLRKYVRYYRDFVLELNKALAVDSRVEICMLPVGDGITLCRRVE